MGAVKQARNWRANDASRFIRAGSYLWSGPFVLKPNVMGPQETVTDAYPRMPYPEAPDPRPASPAAWYDSLLAVSTFWGGRLREVRLYPIDLRHEAAGHRG